jgi:predicted Ser/Thr protein kinase
MANAIESLIMTNRMKAIHTTVTSIAPDEEQSRMLDQVVQYLVDKEGYTTQSARWLLDYFAHRMRLGLGE